MADQHESEPDPDRSEASSAPALETPSSCVHSAPSGEGSSLLLSLPWEVLLHVTSYLPARFVVDVLPQVCRSLRALASDRLTWKVRAQRRLHPAGGGTFPLLETPDFDWPAACLELEEHLSHWSDEGGGAERFSLTEGHFASVESVLLLNGGTVCASGSRDRNVVLWDLRRLGEGAGEGEGGAQVSTLLGNQRYSTHRGWVWCLAAQGSLLCSGSFDSTIKTWDLGACGAPLSEIRGRDAVLCLSCLSDVVVAGSFDKRVSVIRDSMYHALIHATIVEMRAMMTFEHDDIINAGSTMKGAQAVCHRDASGSCAAAISLPDDLLSTIPSPLLTGSAVEQLGEPSEGAEVEPRVSPSLFRVSEARSATGEGNQERAEISLRFNRCLSSYAEGERQTDTTPRCIGDSGPLWCNTFFTSQI
ncbi:UNVERIFIED_CONTAM: hypothetical protein FKN15_069798 [Acipenser sinensis]